MTDLASTDEEYLHGSATNGVLSQITALRSDSTPSSPDPLAGASVTVQAEPVDPSAWQGGAYPQIGTGTTDANGAVQVQLAGLSSVLGNPTYENLAQAVNVDVLVNDPAGSSFYAFTVPVYGGTDPATQSDLAAVPTSMVAGTATQPGTYQMDTSDQAAFDDNSPAPDGAAQCNYSGWSSLEKKYCNWRFKTGGLFMNLGHWRVAQVPLGELHSRDWAERASMNFTAASESTIASTLATSDSAAGSWAGADFDAAGTRSKSEEGGRGTGVDFGNAAEERGNKAGYQMTLGFRNQPQYAFNVQPNAGNPGGKLYQALRVVPGRWDGSGLKRGKNTIGEVDGNAGKTSDGQCPSSIYGNYTIYDQAAGDLCITDERADGTEDHEWSKVMVPGAGPAGRDSGHSTSFGFSWGLGGFLGHWGISIGGKLGGSSSTTYAHHLDYNWAALGPPSSTNRGGCIYGLASDWTTDPIVFAGRPDTGDNCGPKATWNTGGDGNLLQNIQNN
ncbi:MAG TPA: hypothetical protein VFB34_12090 [Chloroflexota bacterium]|nr:hypothetical protein [Chloroflexota bacterium]